MKKYLLIFLTLLSACSAVKKPVNTVATNQSNKYESLQKFKGDTLGYVQHNFIDNKQKYVGKDLNTLLKDVEIPIKSYITGFSYIYKGAIPDISLQFYTFDQVSIKIYRSDKPVNIIIEWITPLPQDSVLNITSKSKNVWTEKARQYFGKQTIGDIMTTNWTKGK